MRDAVDRHRLIHDEERVLVAVSGGPDSVALLHLLLRLREERPFKLHIFHLDHGLRPDSAADAAFVEQISRTWNVPATVLRRDVHAERRPKESTQQAARRVRYEAMRQVARDVGADRIALAHHADDQAETVLLRLLRGTGVTGLGAMRYRRGPFIRPLLDVPRSAVEAYCEAFQLETRHDPSNLSTEYVRNKIRLELMPLLRAEYNPNIRLTLNRMATLLRDDDDLLEALAHRAFRRMAGSAANGSQTSVSRDSPMSAVTLPMAELRRQPRALGRRIVRHAVAHVSPSGTRALTYDHVEAVLALLDDEPGAAVDLPRGVRVQRERDALAFSWIGPARSDFAARSEGSAPSGDFAASLEANVEISLVVPGRTALPGNKVIDAEFVERPAAGVRPNRNEAWLDWEKLSPPLIVRTWRPGDRMRPLGLGGTKKLQDIFVDAKIPVAERRRIPIVVDAAGIVWLAGLRIDDRAAAGPGSSRVLRLRIASL